MAGTVVPLTLVPGLSYKHNNPQIRNAPQYTDARSLAANVSETHTIPTGAKWVIFSSTDNFYAKRGASAAVPGDVTDGTAAELNPAAWWLDANVTQITVISPNACVVTMSFYSA